MDPDGRVDQRLDATLRMLSGGPRGKSTLGSTKSLPSFASLMEDFTDPEPGPGSYEIPSGCGQQTLSTRESPPQRSITAKHSASWEKVLISKHHSNSFLCREGPGCAYDPKMLPSFALRGQVKFGRGRRVPLSHKGGDSPGPVYDVRTKLGQRTAKFSLADRFQKPPRHEDTVGPGQYDSQTQFDGYRLGKSFGCGFKEYKKVKTPGIEKERFGTESPGPGAFRNDFGKNLPNLKHDGCVAFNKAQRIPHRIKGSCAPGPGTYEVVELTTCTRPVNMDSRVTNKPPHSFGKPSHRPRLDFKRMRMFESSTWGMN